jgi:hypothetical protein
MANFFSILLTYLQADNEMAINGIILISAPSLNTIASSQYYPCNDQPSDLINGDISILQSRFEDSKQYLLNLQEILSKKESLLVIICGSVEIFRKILENIPDNFLREHTWLLNNPLVRDAINSSKIPEILLLNSTSELAHKIELNSQIYFWSSNGNAIIVYEIYRPCEKHKLVTNEFARFSINNKIVVKPTYIWKRRQDLKGCEVTVAYIHTPPWIYAVDSIENCTDNIFLGANAIICGSTVSTALLKELSYNLNFSVTFLHSEDNQYGVKSEINGNWTGLIGVLSQKKADVGATTLTIIPSRAEAIDFGVGIKFYYVRLYMIKPKMSIRYSLYLNVFDMSYWNALILTTMLIVTTFVLMICIIRKASGKIENFTLISEVQNLLTGVGVTFQALLALDVCNVKPMNRLSSLSIRIFTLSICFVGMLNLNAFSAGLTSVLTVEHSEATVNSFDDIAQNPRYHLLVLKGTRTELYLSESKDPIVRDIWKRRNTTITFVEDLKEAETLILKNDNIIYVGDDFFESASAYYPNYITGSSKRYEGRADAFGFQPKSPFRLLFNFKLSQYQTFGLYGYKITEQEKNMLYEPEELKGDSNSLGYKSTLFPFMVLSTGCVIALIFYIFEASLKFPLDSKRNEFDGILSTQFSVSDINRKRRNTC